VVVLSLTLQPSRAQELKLKNSLGCITMADPLSIAAGVVGLLTFAGSAITQGYQLSQAMGESRKDIARLLAELAQLTGLLVAIDA
jgi:ABC-type transporter Mla subunit MlaD